MSKNRKITGRMNTKITNIIQVMLVFHFCFAVATLISPNLVNAATTQQYTVNAEVPTTISKENSSVKLSTDRAMADPINHPVLLTVVLLSKDQDPIPNKEVIVTSDRGSIDLIEATSKISNYKAQASEISSMQKDLTDDNGRASFRISSFMPGEAKINVVADGAVKFSETKINFNPRPLPSYISISIDLPLTDRDWYVIPESFDEASLSPLQQEMVRSANVTIKIRVPFSVFAIFVFLAFVLVYFAYYAIIEFHRLERRDAILSSALNNKGNSQTV